MRLPVANVMGGGSSVNAMMYVRGEPRAYDRWNAFGATGWDYSGVLPYFRRFENYEGGATDYHGVRGPIGVSHSRYRSEFGVAFVNACIEKGLARNDDFTGAKQSGAGFYQLTQEKGVRSSSARGYLRLAQARGNLDVLSGTTVDRIVLEGRRAVAIRGRTQCGAYALRAEREIILTAGALGTPRVLLLSGIGPADELQAVGIVSTCDLPGVGRGLQDHPQCSVLFQPRRPVAIGRAALILPFLRWCLTRRGIFASTTLAAGAFLRLSESSELSDCQFSVKWAGSPPHRAAVDFQSGMVDVESRGSVRLRSADPRSEPIVDPNYLSSQREVDVLVRAIHFARSLAHTQAFRAFGLVRELTPGPEIQSKRELERYVRGNVQTAYHPTGTCSMGNGESAVVDPSLRVWGVEGLRVADASIMPRIVNGNTNGPTLMIAEKAADLIRDDA
jgi:choline dehydrogenase-like flavoprotein